MDEMNALERQLASVVQSAMRPPRPVDATAIVRSATSGVDGRWPIITRRLWAPKPGSQDGGRDVFSALKFVAAGVIVALFGGFLLSGVLTAPQDNEVVPAADPTTRTVLVKAPLPSIPGLRPGRFGRLAFRSGERTAHLVPAAAVKRVGQLELVRVVAADGSPAGSEG